MTAYLRPLRCRPFSQSFAWLTLWLLALSFGLKQDARGASVPTVGHVTELRHNWQIQSGCNTHDGGEKISQVGYPATGWIVTDVPATVLGAQVNSGQFEAPFFGMNLRKIPGTDYPIGKLYGYLPMTESSPYRCPWWYRNEFPSVSRPGRKLWLHFNGINYRANLWVNGTRIASSDEVAGALRSYGFDVTDVLKGKQNALAVEVFAQTENDLGIDFLDWNPSPADKSLGLWRNVYLTDTGPVTVRHPEVITHFTGDDLVTAELTVVVDVANHAGRAVSGSLVARVGKTTLRQQVRLEAGEQRIIRFTPDHFPHLRIKYPQVWWPYQYGTPHLEHLRLSYVLGGIESDASNVRFGIREVQGALNQQGYFQFRVNRRNILIRGGGWTPDLFYREPRERLQQELEYVKHMGLNAIRVEGKLGSDDLFDLADELGILVMAGWQCCDFWQQWAKWTSKDHEIAAASTYSQISRLRSHPSLLVWLNGSDEVPAPEVEQSFLNILKERDWPNPVLSAAADRKSAITGASGVKMSGPYDYVPPEYWYLDKTKLGGAYGFNTETSSGPAIPSPAVVRRTLPASSWWPVDEQWNYHAASGKFAQYDIFTAAMKATYGEAQSLNDFSRKAQLMQYDSERAMFEAYAANKYNSTGVIQWLVNSAWPSFFWNLYDYYLTPGGGYFGTRKANEPLHVQYRYDDRRVLAVNSTLEAYRGLRVSARVFDLSGRQRFSSEANLDLAGDGVASAFTIPAQTTTSFLALKLLSRANAVVSENFYWIPAKLADLQWDKSTYFYTPAAPYADMRDLAQLPAGHVLAKARLGAHPHQSIVTVENTGGSIAFFMHLQVVKGGTEEEVTPVLWSDNFVSLLPGESRDLAVDCAQNTDIEIKLEGWNVALQTLRPPSAGKKH
jgi:exo-1,4-beta-D-glucosaminidase